MICTSNTWPFCASFARPHACDACVAKVVLLPGFLALKVQICSCTHTTVEILHCMRFFFYLYTLRAETASSSFYARLPASCIVSSLILAFYSFTPPAVAHTKAPLSRLAVRVRVSQVRTSVCVLVSAKLRRAADFTFMRKRAILTVACTLSAKLGCRVVCCERRSSAHSFTLVMRLLCAQACACVRCKYGCARPCIIRGVNFSLVRAVAHVLLRI
eukprot:1749988-Pleurochrysis_carterae.AAC.9